MNSGQKDGRWPNLFILGAPKCGTTSIASWLSQHPSVLVSNPKEPGFFNDDYKDGHFRRRPKQYRSLFQSSLPKTWFCDATVDYLASENAINSIVKIAPQARFIVAVRNHADLLFSIHQQELISGNELESDFEKAFALSPQRRLGRKIPITRPEPKKIDYEERAKMGHQLIRAIKSIQREHILIVDFEQIIQAPDRIWSEICTFLDIEQTKVDLTPQNTRQEISSVTATVIRKYLRRIKRRLGLISNRGIDTPLRHLSAHTPTLRASISDQLRSRISQTYELDRQLIKKVALGGPAVIGPNSWITK
ncbi:hypothetical protein BVC71_02890 [Marivivens niveibacter]|uniref:Sulfotransferase domain-containing protein n=1 Tax=Marivivens niveibacter TaxID=1930667 RepID=A0A251X1L5_9RHOB|nr:sulfotransferase [Marivivens niveibacter]OUD10461.1 hypothetical protein BVC71_02890 [Marivivens niveibacter]